MGDVAKKYVQARQRVDKKQQGAHLRNPQEQRALRNMRREAKQHGVVLDNDGEGGLPASLVLGVMRRDEYTCKRCGKRDRAKITCHHKGGISESDWLDKKGHDSSPNNLVTICTKCHDDVHEQARDEGVDASQVVAKGDKGNPKYDPSAR
jgi:hypothetical protein